MACMEDSKNIFSNVSKENNNADPEIFSSYGYSIHQILVASIVNFHSIVKQIIKENDLDQSSDRLYYISPRDYMAFLSHFTALVDEKYKILENERNHLDIGLQKLEQTQH